MPTIAMKWNHLEWRRDLPARSVLELTYQPDGGEPASQSWEIKHKPLQPVFSNPSQRSQYALRQRDFLIKCQRQFLKGKTVDQDLVYELGNQLRALSELSMAIGRNVSYTCSTTDLIAAQIKLESQKGELEVVRPRNRHATKKLEELLKSSRRSRTLTGGVGDK